MKIDVSEAWKSLEDIWLPIAAVIFAVLIFVILIRCICKIQRTKASVTLAFTVIIIAGGLLRYFSSRIFCRAAAGKRRCETWWNAMVRGRSRSLPSGR